MLNTKGQTIMKNKLLLTTALVGSVALSSAAIAETKVTGNVEATYIGTSMDKAADSHKGVSALGMETNIGVSHSKELDNGMTLKAGMNLETGNSTDAQATSDVGYVEVSSGNFSVHVGQDYGNNLNTIGIPTVGDAYSDVIATLSDGTTAAIATTNKDLSEEAHDALHLGLAQKFDAGVVYLNYAPSSEKNDTAGDSGGADDGGSILEIGTKLNFGGVSVQLGQQTDEQANDGGSVDSAKQRLYSVGYSFDRFAVGASKRTYDDGNSATANDWDMTSYGITFAASDNLSVGVQIGDVDDESNTSDEETRMISAGYNLGGMGIEFSYAQVENKGATSGTDVDTIQIRSITKF